MPTEHKAAPLALAALFIGASAIGLAPIFVRLSSVGPVATGFWRVFLAMPVFFLMIPRGSFGTEARAYLKPWHGLAILLPGIFFGVDMALWNTSVATTSVANATLLTNISPIFVAWVSWFFFKERFTAIFIIGMIGAFAGCLMLMGSSLQFNPENFRGDVIGAVSGIFYGSYVFSLSVVRKKFDTAHVMFYTSLAGSPLLAVWAWLSGQSLFWDGPQVHGWTVLFAIALVSHVGGQGLIAYALAHLPVTFSSIGLLLQPVVAAIAAIIVFGESLGPLQLAGGIVVLIGVFLCRIGSAAKKEHLEEKYE